MKKLTTRICIVGALLALIVICGLFIWGYREYHRSEKLTKARLDKLSLDGYDNLMITAHPDDETIWGGGHLVKDRYLVVCLTHASDPVRSKEFEKAMKGSNSKYIMLDYPDKVFNRRSNWEYIKSDIEQDIRILLQYKNWETVVTHNKDGEYGHQHHKSLHKYVTNVYENEKKDIKLFYFGKYYSASNIGEEKAEKMSDTLLNTKKKILKVYKSQSFIDKKFGQMYPYEDFQEYKK